MKVRAIEEIVDGEVVSSRPDIKKWGDNGWQVTFEHGATAHISAMQVVEASMSEPAVEAVVVKIAEAK